MRILLAALILFVGTAQASLTGEWSATVAAPRGDIEYVMYLTHEGPRLTGYFQSQFGEIPLRGTVDGENVKITWAMMDGTKEIACVMTGVVKGEVITGTARLGAVGDGAFRAERTGS